jgi:hypothetical protein
MSGIKRPLTLGSLSMLDGGGVVAVTSLGHPKLLGQWPRGEPGWGGPVLKGQRASEEVELQQQEVLLICHVSDS